MFVEKTTLNIENNVFNTQKESFIIQNYEYLVKSILFKCHRKN